MTRIEVRCRAPWRAPATLWAPHIYPLGPTAPQATQHHALSTILAQRTIASRACKGVVAECIRALPAHRWGQFSRSLRRRAISIISRVGNSRWSLFFSRALFSTFTSKVQVPGDPCRHGPHRSSSLGASGHRVRCGQRRHRPESKDGAAGRLLVLHWDSSFQRPPDFSSQNARTHKRCGPPRVSSRASLQRGAAASATPSRSGLSGDHCNSHGGGGGDATVASACVYLRSRKRPHHVQ